MGDSTAMHVVCMGAGYVGVPTMAVIAKHCPHIHVTLFDISEARIAAWKDAACEEDLPLYEPNLAEVVFQTRGRNLFFSTDRRVLKKAAIIFVAVNTPTKKHGVGAGRAADLSSIESCVRTIAEEVVEGHVIVVEKSTVPVRCSAIISEILSAAQQNDRTGATFSVLSSPEFLSEGTAIQNLNFPDRVLIGGQDEEAMATLSSIYEWWVPAERILRMNLWSSELSKLVANAMLAQRISSINSITPLCEMTGASIEEVVAAVGSDTRIGPYFLNASVGFGGSCFRKDILNLVYICESLGLMETARYWEQVLIINEYQKRRFSDLVVHTCFDTLVGKTVAVYGFAFKKETSDTRESAAIAICSQLLLEGATLHIYDPKVHHQQVLLELEAHIDANRLEFSGLMRPGVGQTTSADPLGDYIRAKVHTVSSPLEAARGASALLVLTEWDVFRSLDYQPVYAGMRKPAFVFDGRLVVDREKLERIGFRVFALGNPPTSPLIGKNGASVAGAKTNGSSIV